MARLSISTAWKETSRILQTESRVLIPLVLAFLVVPAAAVQLIAPMVVRNGTPAPGLWVVLSPLIFVLRLFGLLAVTKLALGSPHRLADVLRDALRTLGPVLLLALIVWVPAAAVASFLLMPILRAPTNPPPAAALGLLLLMGAVLFVSVRLSLVMASAASGTRGVARIGRESIELTHGAFWRIFAAALLLFAGFFLAELATQWVLGSSFYLLFGKLEPLSVQLLLLSFMVQMVDAAGAVVFAVLIARIFVQRRVAPGVPSTGV